MALVIFVVAAVDTLIYSFLLALELIAKALATLQSQCSANSRLEYRVFPFCPIRPSTTI